MRISSGLFWLSRVKWNDAVGSILGNVGSCDQNCFIFDHCFFNRTLLNWRNLKNNLFPASKFFIFHPDTICSSLYNTSDFMKWHEENRNNSSLQCGVSRWDSPPTLGMVSPPALLHGWTPPRSLSRTAQTALCNLKSNQMHTTNMFK